MERSKVVNKILLSSLAFGVSFGIGMLFSDGNFKKALAVGGIGGVSVFAGTVITDKEQNESVEQENSINELQEKQERESANDNVQTPIENLAQPEEQINSIITPQTENLIKTEDDIEEQRTIAEQQGITVSLDIVEPETNNNIENQNLEQEELFTMSGDWDSLARLFTNLLANAIKYTAIKNISEKNQSPLEIAIQLKQINKNLNSRKVREYNRQNYLQVTIKDTGKGIAESDLPYIFDRFYRVDPARHHQKDLTFGTGSGLGLAIAKAIVENHQGKITVETIINQGTRFQIILPQTKYAKY